MISDWVWILIGGLGFVVVCFLIWNIILYVIFSRNENKPISPEKMFDDMQEAGFPAHPIEKDTEDEWSELDITKDPWWR